MTWKGLQDCRSKFKSRLLMAMISSPWNKQVSFPLPSWTLWDLEARCLYLFPNLATSCTHPEVLLARYQMDGVSAWGTPSASGQRSHSGAHVHYECSTLAPLVLPNLSWPPLVLRLLGYFHRFSLILCPVSSHEQWSWSKNALYLKALPPRGKPLVHRAQEWCADWVFSLH